MSRTLKTKLCSWCRGGSILDSGPGHFRDLDSDFSYGIDICGGCGGLGRIILNQDFSKRISRINELRFEYCPVGKTNPPPVASRLQKLEALSKEVTELFRIYGQKEDKCFAQEIAEGCLQPIVETLQKKQESK